MNFNDYVDDYSRQIERAIPCLGARHSSFLAEKATALLKLATGHFPAVHSLSVLDVGCGIGLMERALAGKFRRLAGVDVAAEAVEQARHAQIDAEFFHSDGHPLPFEDGEFNIAFACCVFHHVPLADRPGLVREMFRVIAPGGLVVIFEHNPWNPLTRLIVARCEFDRDAILLSSAESADLLRAAGLQQLRKQQLLYFPWRNRFWRAVESLLGWAPLGAQYFVSGVRSDDVEESVDVTEPIETKSIESDALVEI